MLNSLLSSVIVICLALAILFRVGYKKGLLLALFSITWINFSFFDGEVSSRLSIPDLFFFALFLYAMVYEAACVKPWMTLPVQPILFMSAMVVSILISYIFSPLPTSGMILGGGEPFIIFFGVVIFILVCILVQSEGDYRLILDGWMLSMVAVVMMCTWDGLDLVSRRAVSDGVLSARSGFFGVSDFDKLQFFQHSYLSPLAARIMGPFRSNGQLAAYSLTSFFVFAGISMTSEIPRWKRVTAFFLTWTVVLACLLSMTFRVIPSLSAGIGLFLIYAFFKSKKMFLAALTALIMIVGVLAGIAWVNPDIIPWWKQFLSFSGPQTVIGASPVRAMFLGQALKGFFDFPIFGIGFGRFVESFYHMLPRGVEIHNTPLQFLTEAGLVGFSTYCAFMIYFFWTAFQNWRKSRGTAWEHFFTILLFGVLTMPASYFYNRHLKERTFWIFLALIYLGHELLTRFKREKNEPRNC